MRCFRLLVPLLAALAAGPAGAQDGRVWTVALPKDGEAALRYASPMSDGQMLGYLCARRSGQIRIVAASPVRLTEPQDADMPAATPVDIRRPATVTVSAGAAAASLPGRVAPDIEHGGSSIVTEISTASPVIGAFRKTAVIRVTVLHEGVEAPPVPGGMLRAFLGYCR
ncbi:hypothetical protein [Phenylobacterium sp.]|jgi:hypothetical protein|uniref:hypothetical protein n=1 Tax=Phenylobacterium sp. TaxID=1871053 RepID=UPI002F426D38